VHLARKYSTARLLLTTFSETLAGFLREKVRRLASGEPGVLERIEVHAFEEVGRRLYSRRFGEPVLIDNQELHHLLSNASNTSLEHRFSDRFLWSEWNEVVDAWQLDSWEAYRDVPRLGRKTRLAETQRRLLWEIFERVHSELASRKLVTLPRMFARLTQELLDKTASPYDFVVVDEAQDIGVAELRFLAALGKSRPDSLFFAGDLGQRIFQPPFSWKSLGIDVRGRSRTLRINYRTSHQIRVQADRLLPPEMSDVDGNKEQRRGTVSAFNGPAPEIRVFDSTEEESQAAGQWMNKITAAGVHPHEIGVFVRSKAQVDRARRAVESVGYAYLQPQEKARMKSGHVAIMPMHLAKGLEFRGVLVMACDDEIIPLQERITAVADDIDLEEIYNTERHLLYVACTRARDHLLVTGVNPVSEFLDDLGEE
jgi:superfamily I DNA/RNA helicase